MGVDHGLGGRESERSKLRREKKARRIKAVAKKLQSEGFVSPKEIKFDENARKEWLTGFRKRKQERRKFGLAMEILKQKKHLKEAAKERRQILKDEGSKKPINLDTNEEEDDEEEDGNDDGEENNNEEENDDDENEDDEELFEDDATVSMFGSAVSVVVSDKIGDDEDDIDDGMSISTKGSASSMRSKSSAHGGKTLSNFDKAMRKAKQMMGTKKKKNNLDRNGRVHKSIKKKVESNKLLDKALGRKLGHKKRK